LEGRYRLRGDEARHLARVSRHGPGDLVELFDGQGFAIHARVASVSPDLVELIAEGPPLVSGSSPCSLTLASAAPKGERFDWLVEKATELGVARLVPLITDRSVVDPRASKLKRLRRTVIEACKQCRRSDLMRLEPPQRWAEFLNERTGGGTRLIALQSGLPPARWPALRSGGEVVLAVGPEGGFSPEEVDLALRHGWHPVRLGTHVLRVETAGIAGISAILSSIREGNSDGLD
jgi:16S rRNA (uracil1498-N3)-methyltransferase